MCNWIGYVHDLAHLRSGHFELKLASLLMSNGELKKGISHPRMLSLFWRVNWLEPATLWCNNEQLPVVLQHSLRYWPVDALLMWLNQLYVQITTDLIQEKIYTHQPLTWVPMRIMKDPKLRSIWFGLYMQQSSAYLCFVPYFIPFLTFPIVKL